MRTIDESGVFAITARLELESNNLRKIAKGKHLREVEKNHLETYAKRLDFIREDMKVTFPKAF